jgi:hypothetical protein
MPLVTIVLSIVFVLLSKPGILSKENENSGTLR